MKPTFLIDADEVLANFAGPAVEAISLVLGRPWTLAEAPPDTWDMFGNLTDEQVQEVDHIIDAPGWCWDLEPYPGSQEMVEALQKLCDVYVVTSPRLHGVQWVYERNGWLKRYFGFLKADVVQTSAKHICAGDFFLDDHPEHVQAWQKQKHNRESLGMLWSTEHNKRLVGYDDIRVHSRGEVIERVKARIAAE